MSAEKDIFMEKINYNKHLHLYKVFDSGHSGGVERVIYNICKVFKDKSNSIFVSKSRFGKGKNDIFEFGKIYKTFSLGTLFSMPIAPFYIFKAMKLIKNNDIIHIHYPFPLNDIVISLTNTKNKKIIYHFHSDIIKQRFLKYIFYPFSATGFRKADKIIVSNTDIKKYSKILSKYQEKCEVIEFGLDDNFNQL